MIGDSKRGRIIEVDPAGKVVWSYENPDIGNMRMRNYRRTASGTTLIVVEAAGKVIEVDKAGQVVWGYVAEDAANRFPYQAHRLPNRSRFPTEACWWPTIRVDDCWRLVRPAASCIR